MATRHQAREAVISLLYAYDIGNSDISEFCDDILEDNKIRNRQKEFALSLFNGTLENLEKIDELISRHLDTSGISKTGTIERSIIRLGTYELIKKDADSAVIINEAIELSKKLASDGAPKFINGVLDAIKNELS